MHEGPSPRIHADLPLRAAAFMLDGMIVGAAKLLLRATGAPWLVAFAAAAGYYTWMPLAYEGQTFGKMAAGIAVVDEKKGKLTAGQLLGRYAGYLLSTVLLGAGFLVAFFNPHRRALHDILADTRVVEVSKVDATRRWTVLGVGLGGFLLSAAVLLIGAVAALTR